MKNFTFLVASFLFFGGVANASEIIKFSDVANFRTFSNAEPIAFTERGIEFYIFPDGQFDFNTEPSQGEMYYRTARRGNVNATYGAPANTVLSGVKIEHDSQGRVRRIGNVFVNYDAQDRIKRIGSVYMTYNNFNLTRVGNLQIVYNRRGQIIDMIGNVNGRSCLAQNGSTSTYYGNSQGYNNNNDNIYYRNANEKEVKTKR